MTKHFSIRRALLSCLLGFLIPLSYAFLLVAVSEYLRQPTLRFLSWPVAWPSPMVVPLMRRPPTIEDFVGALVFIAACNILLYGTVVYVALTMRSVVRNRRVDYEPPPPPERFPSADE